MSGALAARPSDKEQDKGRVDKTKVRRYWQGKAPEWGAGEGDDAAAAAAATGERLRTEVAAPVIVRRAADDPRLRRLAASRVTQDEREEAVARHREIRAAEIVSQRRRGPEGDGEVGASGRRRGEEGDEEEEEQEAASDDMDQDDDREGGRRERRQRASAAAAAEEEEALRKRQAVRERLLQQQKEQEAAAAAAGGEEEEEEEESEYETDSEEEEEVGFRLLKPVFVPKESRETIAERERLEAEAAAAEEAERKRVEERKMETRAIVVERLALEEATAKAAAAGPKELNDVDTDDEAGDPVEAYESWKQRELRRIRRDREEKENAEAEAAEKEKLKNMTEAERAMWEKANPKVQPQDTKEKWRFLQKYWHKGAYFQQDTDDVRGTVGTDSIFARDYSAPTGEDKFDKSLMPAVMQVKNFGRSGRTKYTHLMDQDTTQLDDPFYDSLKDGARKRERTAGSAAEFAKPRKFKR